MDITATVVIYEAFVGTFPGLVYRRTGRDFSTAVCTLRMKGMSIRNLATSGSRNRWFL